MRFIFPASPLASSRPDESFEDQIKAFQDAGFKTSLIAFEDAVHISPPPDAEETFVYRGWMLAERDYARFIDSLTSCGANAFTSHHDYLAAHYLPNWYPILADLTAETYVFPPDADLQGELARLGWKRFFIKDFVKSLKTGGGSTISSPADAPTLVAEMKKFRGTIEGGFCVRRFEDFVTGSEIRYFVIRGRPYGYDSKTAIPLIVREVADRMKIAYYSIDIAVRKDGTPRVVEIGDGQVSDIVGWKATRLAEVWAEAVDRS